MERLRPANPCELDYCQEVQETYYGGFVEEAYADIYDNDYVVAFTLNPDPARYPTHRPDDQYRILMPYIYKGIDKIFSAFCFLPELTDAGNVHIHGFYVVKDRIKYYRHWLPKIKALGHTVLKQMFSKEWLTYLTKRIEENAELMDPYPVPLTHCNYRTYEHKFIVKRKLKAKEVLNSKQYADIARYFNKKK